MTTRKGRTRQAVRHPKKGKFPSWLGALSGMVIGVVIVMMLIHYSLIPISPPVGPQPDPQAKAKPDSNTGLLPAGTTATRPRYDFYSVLPEREVRIPDTRIDARRTKAGLRRQRLSRTTAQKQTRPKMTQRHTVSEVISQNVIATPPGSGQKPTGNGYLLQVGAFPNPTSAETLKARLALRGFIANVRGIHLGQQTYYRVRLGPYDSARAVKAVKQRLKAVGIPAIVLKARSWRQRSDTGRKSGIYQKISG